MKHHMPTPGGRPSKYQPHRMPYHLKSVMESVMENQIDEMLQNKIISEAASVVLGHHG